MTQMNTHRKNSENQNPSHHFSKVVEHTVTIVKAIWQINKSVGKEMYDV